MDESSFGARLRQRRMERGASLEAISAATRIGVRLLEAFENEQWNRLPGGIFNRGFLRSIARHLKIDEEALIGLLEECERANGEAPITFFEITTAAALFAFSRVEADIALLETGPGGPLDATTVLPAPAVTPLTATSNRPHACIGHTPASTARAANAAREVRGSAPQVGSQGAADVARARPAGLPPG